MEEGMLRHQSDGSVGGRTTLVPAEGGLTSVACGVSNRKMRLNRDPPSSVLPFTGEGWRRSGLDFVGINVSPNRSLAKEGDYHFRPWIVAGHHPRFLRAIPRIDDLRGFDLGQELAGHLMQQLLVQIAHYADEASAFVSVAFPSVGGDAAPVYPDEFDLPVASVHWCSESETHEFTI